MSVAEILTYVFGGTFWIVPMLFLMRRDKQERRRYREEMALHKELDEQLNMLLEQRLRRRQGEAHGISPSELNPPPPPPPPPTNMYGEVTCVSASSVTEAQRRHLEQMRALFSAPEFNEEGGVSGAIDSLLSPDSEDDEPSHKEADAFPELEKAPVIKSPERTGRRRVNLYGTKGIK